MMKVSTPWASTNRNGNIETFTDLVGMPTTTRPHVHTIYHEVNGSVDIVATASDGKHPYRVNIQDPDGNEVANQQRKLANRSADWERSCGRGFER